MRNSGFISKAACRGYRPSRFSSHNSRQRPHLIARLAKERATARFVVAPAGYGKTSLAIDYAETMFAWTHVFWINAESPCFIRDLDDGEIAEDCKAIDPDVKLVVIDDLPQLDAARVERLSSEIDALLAAGSEVLVMCIPSCDLLGALQIDRVRIGASDLLLDDEEIDLVRTDAERLRLAAVHVPAAERVPALVWDSKPAATAAFLAESMREDLPADLLLAMCGVLALHKGAISDLAKFGPFDADLASDSFADYPHLGFDAETGRFEAPLVDVDLLVRAVKGKMGVLVERSRFDSRDSLVRAWASVLLRNADASGRACDLMRVFVSAESRASWLLEHSWELARSGSFLPMHRLIESLKGGGYDSGNRVVALDAVCLRMLGDEQGCVRKGKRCAFKSDSSDDARLIGLLMLARFAPGALRENAVSALAERASALREGDLGSMSWYDALAVAWAARREGVGRLCSAWCGMRDAGMCDDVLCLVASWLFALVLDPSDSDAAFSIRELAPVERYVRSRLAGDDPASTSFFATSAGLSMEEAHARGMAYFHGPLEAGVLLGLRHAEMSVFAQRRELERRKNEERLRRSGLLVRSARAGVAQEALAVAEQRAVPLLELKMFGRLDMSIGGVPIEPGCVGRKQSRALLAMLVANRGKDISRDAMAHAMWPTRDQEGARKNFYTTWSQLRRALTLPDGTCPYLVRHQFGCRLEERYVKSDMARFDDICRELLFGRLDFESWHDMYNEIDRDFSCELMPVEEDSPLLAKLRVDCHNKLVDALVTASLRLTEADNPQWAIWYSRMAIERESTREDAYVALMRAQIAYDQRTAAMMTYLNCRNILAEQLGIDPSPEMTKLYDSLLGS